jgi:hypothetical protein
VEVSAPVSGRSGIVGAVLRFRVSSGTGLRFGTGRLKATGYRIDAHNASNSRTARSLASVLPYLAMSCGAPRSAGDDPTAF